MKPGLVPVVASVARNTVRLPGAPCPRNLRYQLCLHGVSYTSRQAHSAGAAVPQPEVQVFLDSKTSSLFPEPVSPNESECRPHRPFSTSNDTASKASLPISCPGCGALAQEVDSTEPGFYSRSRKAVRAYLKSKRSRENLSPTQETTGENEKGVENTRDEAKDKKTTDPTCSDPVTGSVPIPACDRCHDLMYNFRGSSIAHPSLEDIADSIAESPFSRNHVYHVLDAADFPMSLEPLIFSKLSLAKPRSRNRRSQHAFSHRPTLSFIITRSDLLGPTKETVDGLKPHMQKVLRTALGRVGENLRLGNVHLVSAKRGWWTKDIKEAIWKRGGGNWMVGKFNVGKSNLFEVLFPKGSSDRAPSYAGLAQQPATSAADSPESQLLSETSLLPPAQPETRFPTMPLVSNLPGTTASPIRLSFGNHKGELIDLPGLERGNLADFVHPDHKLDLVMTERPKVSQYTIQPGQSLLLAGGLVRITPFLDENVPSTTMMAYPFVPLDAHVTATDKAIGTQQQTRESGIKSILADNVGGDFRSAGIISLDTDVTRSHAGPLLRAGVPLDRLPFRLYSTDLLIQGVGWVELVCEVRPRRRIHSVSKLADTTEQIENDPLLLADDKKIPKSTSFKPYTPALESKPQYEYPLVPPSVEVFTPDGKHIGKRVPLGIWTRWKEGRGRSGGTGRKRAVSMRPRQSMKGAKRLEKVRRKIVPQAR